MTPHQRADQIAAATRRARAGMDLLTLEAAEDLRALYESIIAQLQRELRAYADDQGNLRAELLNQYLRQAQQRLGELGPSTAGLLRDYLADAAERGADIWRGNPGIPRAALPGLADAAARFVTEFIAADGLQLSDRIWRLENGAREAVAEVLRRNVILGRDASRAAREFLEGDLPPEIARNLGKDGVANLERAIADALVKDPNCAYQRALRVYRTEMNRAHGEAYRNGLKAHPEIVGERFVLSPNHPEPDICDDLAAQDLFGMGPGVYPVGQAPWPAHPNTMSYLVAVFDYEVANARAA